MDKNKLLFTASAIFGVIALAHLLRAVLGWQIIVESFEIPVYFSYIAFIILGFLAWIMYKARK